MKINVKNIKINHALETIFSKRPQLANLETEDSIIEYLKPALEWKQDQAIFPYAALLSDILTQEIERLYDENWANKTKDHLKKSWVIETGSHLNIPRRFNKPAVAESSSINSLLFQGQVLWAFANHKLGNSLSLSLNSGRVPPDNTNSGAYLDLPALKQPITLVSRKKHPDSPQTLIPARTEQEITEKIELLNMYYKQKMLPENQYLLGQEILKNFLKVRSGFNDQVATSHALMIDKVIPVKQITLDSEPVGKEFFLKLIKDPNSLIYKIFNNPSLKVKFIEYFADIRTGWPKGGMPFHFVKEEGEGFRLINYVGDLDTKSIIKGLEEDTLFLTGVLKFFTLMVEGGILPSGGWTQAGYCTDIRNQAIKFLDELGEYKRADLLKAMPTHIAIVAPCWGIDQIGDNFQLLDPITMILDSSRVDFSNITKITGSQALLIATPILYEFLKEEESMSIGYNQMQDILEFAVVHRNSAKENELVIDSKKIHKPEIFGHI